MVCVIEFTSCVCNRDTENNVVKSRCCTAIFPHNSLPIPHLVVFYSWGKWYFIIDFTHSRISTLRFEFRVQKNIFMESRSGLKFKSMYCTPRLHKPAYTVFRRIIQNRRCLNLVYIEYRELTGPIYLTNVQSIYGILCIYMLGAILSEFVNKRRNVTRIINKIKKKNTSHVACPVVRPSVSAILSGSYLY